MFDAVVFGEDFSGQCSVREPYILMPFRVLLLRHFHYGEISHSDNALTLGNHILYTPSIVAFTIIAFGNLDARFTMQQAHNKPSFSR